MISQTHLIDSLYIFLETLRAYSISEQPVWGIQKKQSRKWLTKMRAKNILGGMALQ